MNETEKQAQRRQRVKQLFETGWNREALALMAANMAMRPTCQSAEQAVDVAVEVALEVDSRWP